MFKEFSEFWDLGVIMNLSKKYIYLNHILSLFMFFLVFLMFFCNACVNGVLFKTCRCFKTPCGVLFWKGLCLLSLLKAIIFREQKHQKCGSTLVKYTSRKYGSSSINAFELLLLRCVMTCVLFVFFFSCQEFCMFDNVFIWTKTTYKTFPHCVTGRM